jgi:hypothetical protein
MHGMIRKKLLIFLGELRGECLVVCDDERRPLSRKKPESLWSPPSMCTM